MAQRLVTLTTDFGTVDGYVGEMKGVILSRATNVCVVDITHDIPAQDVERARLTLARVWRRFPAGTIHVAVVDPGVGSSRAAIAVAVHDHVLIGPDNGVLSPALLMPGARVVELPVPPTASATFHGRDVFAPAAAAVALGNAIDSLGQPFSTPIVRRTPEATRGTDGSIHGQVISIDRFGNALTNLITRRDATFVVGTMPIPLRRTYAEVNVGEAVALIGSTGFVEIAVRNGSAAERLRLARGSVVAMNYK